jgi:hypothetical protein
MTHAGHHFESADEVWKDKPAVEYGASGAQGYHPFRLSGPALVSSGIPVGRPA